MLIFKRVYQLAKAWLTTFWLRYNKPETLPKRLAFFLMAVESISVEVCALVKIFLCLLPLALARIIPSIVNQTVYKALATKKDDVKQLAGFGIAFNMYQLFECCMTAFCTVSQVLVHSRQDRRLVVIIALAIASMLTGTCVLLSVTTLGKMCFVTLFNVDREIVDIAQQTLGYICVNIFVEALCDVHAGIIIQTKDSECIFLASLLNLSVQMTICLTLSRPTVGLFHPLLLPIFAIYAGTLVKFIVLMTWYYCRVQHRLLDVSNFKTTTNETLRVFLPLASLASARAITVPLARIYVGKDLSSTQAGVENAVLSLVLPVERLFTSWLNRLKDVYLAFKNDKSVQTTNRILLFTSLCLISSVWIMSIFCLIHGLGNTYFHDIFKLDWKLAKRCTDTMAIFLYLPFFSCARAHAIFWLVKKKFTSVIMPCVFLRLIALPITDWALDKLHIEGAKLGAALCVACHGVEALLLITTALAYKRIMMKKPELEKQPLLAANDDLE